MACLAWFIKMSYGTPEQTAAFSGQRDLLQVHHSHFVDCGVGAVLSLLVPGNKADGSIAKKRKVP